MAEIRTNHRSNKDYLASDLSLDAIGFLSLILHKGDDDLTQKEQLDLADCGRHKLTRIKRELRDEGFLEVEEGHDTKGHFHRIEKYSGRA